MDRISDKDSHRSSSSYARLKRLLPGWVAVCTYFILCSANKTPPAINRCERSRVISYYSVCGLSLNFPKILVQEAMRVWRKTFSKCIIFNVNFTGVWQMSSVRRDGVLNDFFQVRTRTFTFWFYLHPFCGLYI